MQQTPCNIDDVDCRWIISFSCCYVYCIDTEVICMNCSYPMQQFELLGLIMLNIMKSCVDSYTPNYVWTMSSLVWLGLRILSMYDAKTAKISSFWTFWPIIQLIYNFQKCILVDLPFCYLLGSKVKLSIAKFASCRSWWPNSAKTILNVIFWPLDFDPYRSK